MIIYGLSVIIYFSYVNMQKKYITHEITDAYTDIKYDLAKNSLLWLSSRKYRNDIPNLVRYITVNYNKVNGCKYIDQFSLHEIRGAICYDNSQLAIITYILANDWISIIIDNFNKTYYTPFSILNDEVHDIRTINKKIYIEAYYNLIYTFIIAMLLSFMYMSLVLVYKAILNSNNTDILTGLKRRDLFEKRLINSYGGNVILIDIDYFKKINDKYGHYFGDIVIREVSKRISLFFRKNDLCFRWGGEEFLIYLPISVSHKRIYMIAEKILDDISRYKIDNINVTVSIGITLTNDKKISFSELYRKADNALYESKKLGRNRITAIGD